MEISMTILQDRMDVTGKGGRGQLERKVSSK